MPVAVTNRATNVEGDKLSDPFKKTPISIVAQSGESRGESSAILTSELAVIDDPMVVVEVGDEIRRRLPNGNEEAFLVVDPVFYDVGIGRLGPHYQVKIKRKGQFPVHTGGNYNVTVSGSNARVNIGSEDNSHNVVYENSAFDNLRRAIADGVSDAIERERLAELVAEMEREKGKPGFLSAYQQFVSSAADHLALLGPLLPTLSAFFPT